MIRILIPALVFASLLLSSCSLFSVHKIDIQQGNALVADTVDQLEVGMTGQQVKFLLGNPLVTDAFHKQRWDYVYYLKPGEGEIEQRRLTVHFEGGKVSRIDRPG